MLTRAYVHLLQQAPKRLRTKLNCVYNNNVNNRYYCAVLKPKVDIDDTERELHRGRLQRSIDKMSAMANNGLPPKVHFYRRVLPESCISFSSDEGKQLFKEALANGHMECYFKLAAQFRTQDEPAFCGLSTMVMVLNALDIDPGRIWKGPWRWYHENMLDCCVPLEVVEQKGITFEQFLCVASCNSLIVNPTRMTDEALTVERFRDIVKEYTQRDDTFVVLSYSRQVLNQTGDGHFSPIGGYHPERDLILVLDTARFKYPPHWVPLELIYEAMKALDMDTGCSAKIVLEMGPEGPVSKVIFPLQIQAQAKGKPRGLMVMSKRKKSQQLLLFRLANNMSLTAPGLFSQGIPEFMLKWWKLLKQKPEQSLSVDQLAAKAAQDMSDLLCKIEKHVIIMTTQLDINCPEDIAKEHECVVFRLITCLEKTLIFEKVTEILNFLSLEKRQRLENLFGSQGRCCSEKCKMSDRINCKHYLAFFILSWPYQTELSGEVTLGGLYGKMVEEQLQSEKCDILPGEVKALQDQLNVLIDVCVNNMDGVGVCCKNRKRKSQSCHSQV